MILTCAHALRILFVSKRSLQSIFLPEGYLAILLFKKYCLKLFMMEGFKCNQNQSELYKSLYSSLGYINQLAANFVLPVSLSSSPHDFEAVLRCHIILSLNNSIPVSKT